MKISVCIPTYNRFGHLKQAIESCLAQTYKPFEIIISNDSSNDKSEKMIKQLQADSHDISIRYIRNKPSLKQVKNVNQLFEMALGDYIILLHDDDLLHHEALETFKSCYEQDESIDIVFGKQYFMNDDGQVDIKRSEILNKVFYRTSQFEINPLKPIEAGLVQQFPNDAYIIKSHIAKENGYREEAKDACDYEFGLRLGIKNYTMHFINKFTAYYRESNTSLSNNTYNNAGLTSYQIAKNTPVPESSLVLKNRWMLSKSPIACVQAINLSNKKEAWAIYFDPWHRKKIFTLGGLKRFLMLLIK
tara:strand:- start:292 stop:1200 length:909 start_codon:yes stop_codon:yes gene_type:complete